MTNKYIERRPYLMFEKEVTLKLDSLFRAELNPEIKEMIRLQTLKTRIFCRDYWTALGKEVPKRIRFSEENKRIELVKKWLADKGSVSYEELRANADSADAAAYAKADAAVAAVADAVADAAVAAAAADGAAARAAAKAARWVKKYEEMTNE